MKCCWKFAKVYGFIVFLFYQLPKFSRWQLSKHTHQNILPYCKKLKYFSFQLWRWDKSLPNTPSAATWFPSYIDNFLGFAHNLSCTSTYSTKHCIDNWLVKEKKALCQISGACTRGGIGCASGRPICQQALLPGILTKQAESSSHT